MTITIIVISAMVFMIAALGLSVGIIAGRRQPKGKCPARDCVCEDQGNHDHDDPDHEPCEDCPNKEDD